jgi:DNA invertase Pin-like site-specific DNA recombinase
MEKKHAILLVRVSTLEQDYQAQIYDLTQYGNSLGYTQFHIVETKETAFADLSQRLEQMKCLNTLMNTLNINNTNN